MCILMTEWKLVLSNSESARTSCILSMDYVAGKFLSRHEVAEFKVAGLHVGTFQAKLLWLRLAHAECKRLSAVQLLNSRSPR